MWAYPKSLRSFGIMPSFVFSMTILADRSRFSFCTHVISSMLFRCALLLSSLVASCVQGNDVKCEKKSSCSCEMNNGMGRIDLSSLASKDKNSPRFIERSITSLCSEHSLFFRFNTGDNRYTYNPCFSFNQGDCTAENEVAVRTVPVAEVTVVYETKYTFPVSRCVKRMKEASAAELRQI